MGVPLPTLRLRSCGQGRRAAGYAIASVLRFATHRADARPPHASRKKTHNNTKTKLTHPQYSTHNHKTSPQPKLPPFPLSLHHDKNRQPRL
ncbi:MAG: hypothetical protein NZ519_11175 [Bacteroidia bacterium]|nr:hypothetical protein [Bacteroidia bacterium]